jgi:hypothetical protein
MNLPDDLQPLDVLLYRTPDLVDWLIETKEGGDVAHVEAYQGFAHSMASRNGLGVNTYPFRLDGLVYVRRPVESLNLTRAFEWHETVRGDKYDWLGLARFYNLVKHGTPHRYFCSAYIDDLFRHAGAELFSPEIDADQISPFDLRKTPLLRTIYAAKP